jgi:hypothetical protein
MRYRDSKTGRLVSKSTWKRSKAQGGGRYKRERPITKRRKKPTPTPPVPTPITGIFEWLITFSYKTRVKSLDIIATASDADEAEDKALAFIARDRKAKQILDSLDKFKVSAKRGRKVGHHHPTQWRSQSRA